MSRACLFLLLAAACGGDDLKAAAGVDSGTGTPDAADPLDATPGPKPFGLRITEINAASTAADLVELVATGDGKLDGIKVNELTNSSYTFTFPDGFTVKENDVIVLHLGGACSDLATDAASCGTTAPFTAKAWDFSMPGTFSYSGKVLEVVDGAGASLDAVPFVQGSGTPPATYVGAVQMIQSRAMWNATPCVDDPSTGMAKDRYCRNISVLWDGLKNDNTNSVIRLGGAKPLEVPGSGAQWTAALPATFGSHP
jgi:hypothetical protein